MFENLREDLRAAKKWNSGRLRTELLNPGTQAVVVFRFGHWCRALPVPVLRHALVLLHIVMDYFTRAFLGVVIHTGADIGPGLLIHSWGGIFVPPIRIGRNFTVQHGAQVNWNCRAIGDDVVLGPGCKIGPDLTIGSRVLIGPNSVVTKDVPDDTTVVMPPPRMLRIRLRERSRAPAEATTNHR